MSKAADAFRTISEVAGELEVPKHVLRFWEAKFAQIRPMKRGGGRRYYRPADMELLRGIRHLLHAEGYTIKGVQKILREQGIDAVKVFGRADDAPAADRAKPARRQEQPSEISKAVSALTGEAAPAPAPQPRRSSTIAAGDALDKIIRELEACRAILLGGGARAEAQRSPRRARASRV